MNRTNRMLAVKAVEYEPRRGTSTDWLPPRIEDLLLEVFDQAKKVSDRHYPVDYQRASDGARCNFVNDFRTLGDSGLLFTVCSYVKGHTPEAFSPKLDESSVDIDAMTILDDDGNPRELVYTYRVLAFGQIVIVENVMGSGGIGALQRLLRSLCARFKGCDEPAIKFTDIESQDLRDLISSKKGIKTVQATFLYSNDSIGSRFSAPLAEVHSAICGTNRCVIRWEADTDDSISTNDGLELLEDPAVINVSMQFNKGGGIKDLQKYRETKRVRLNTTASGRVSTSEAQMHLLEYLNELRDPDSPGPIDYQGNLKRNFIPIGESK